jgi:hypothetical protein
VTEGRENAPIAVLYVPEILAFRALFPTAVLKHPVVVVHKASVPTAVLLLPEVNESRALQPRETLPATAPTVTVVQPRITPKTVGVASGTALLVHRIEFAPVEERT